MRALKALKSWVGYKTNAFILVRTRGKTHGRYCVRDQPMGAILTVAH